MNIRQLEHIAHTLGGVFSLQQIQLYEPDFLRNNLIRRNKHWYIKRVSKWRYCLDTVLNEEIRSYYSNKIYEPSYIGMESALRYYDLIPEGVFITTACTTKKTKKLSWDLAPFYYYHIKPSLFWWYTIRGSKKNPYYVGQVEKVLCDFFYLKPHLKTWEDIAELRIDTMQLQDLTTPALLRSCAEQFHNTRVSHMIDFLISSVW